MADELKCKNCGRPIQAEGGQALCPHCLLNIALEPGKEESGETDLEISAVQVAGIKGNRMGDYELLEEIGRGGMGVVYKARQISLNRMVAFKMIRHAELASVKMLQRFILEAKVTARLEHPNIVTTYGSGEIDGEPFICMRLIEGTNLAKEIPRLSMGVIAKGKERTLGSRALFREAQERIAELMAMVAGAVHYAHH